MNGGWGISYEIALRWMPLDLADDKSTLVEVMAWCCQATSHYLSQCWPRSMSPNGFTRPQWVKIVRWNCKENWMILEVVLDRKPGYDAENILVYRVFRCEMKLPTRKRKPGPWFHIKMSFYHYRKSHCGDKTVANHFIFTMGFPIMVRWHLDIKSAPTVVTRVPIQYKDVVLPV